MNLELISEKTQVVIQTGTEGLFNPFAHNLEFHLRNIKGVGRFTGPYSGTSDLTCSMRDSVLIGALSHDAVDPKILSEADKLQIQKRLQKEVAEQMGNIEIKAMLIDNQATLNIDTECGKQVAHCLIMISQPEPHLRIFEGRFLLSLKLLGIKPITGPLGIFRVADTLKVRVKGVYRIVESGQA